MKPNDDERRVAAERLRAVEWAHEDELARKIEEAVGCGIGQDWEDMGVVDRLSELIEPAPVTGSTSDGYHTFDELYDHRAKLFSVIVKAFGDRAWKSLKHADGTMYDGMFIVGVETPSGQATYHYDVDTYWGMFDCEELDAAPEWDGHTPSDAIERIAALAELIEPASERTCRSVARYHDDDSTPWPFLVCSECGEKLRYRDVVTEHGEESCEMLPYCAGCGAKVAGE